MSQVIDGLRQLKRQWTTRGRRPIGAERMSHQGRLCVQSVIVVRKTV
jgi:hypothetical protein